MSDDPLAEYRALRDLDVTPEPGGGGRKPGEQPLFVVQEHDASSHHFDFRLEIEGVLASWAVPKGPSTDPREKRLAVRTEDHPLDYGDFEGVIPEGEYGGGKVIVWDLGPYRNVTADDDGNVLPIAEALENGHLKVWLGGEKLQGAWALTHAKLGGDEKNWLLVKVDDAGADARRKPTSTEPESVLSGRTVDDAPQESYDDDGSNGDGSSGMAADE